MTRSIPHTVRFREVTTYTTVVESPCGDDAIAQVERMLVNLSPADRATTIMAMKTERDGFLAEPIRRSFNVMVETKAFYEIEVEAINEEDACEIAEDKWNNGGFQDFSFEDFMDERFSAVDDL